MKCSRKPWLVGLAALTLLGGALVYRASTAPIPPEAGGNYLRKLGVDPNNMSWEDKVALAERAKAGSYGGLEPADAQRAEALLQRDPKDARPHRSLGIYYRYKSRDLAKSLLHWREAVRLEPSNNQTKWELGITLMLAGQRDEAMRTFEQMASTKVEGSGLARKFAEEDVELGRKWLEKMRAKPSLGLPRTLAPAR